MKMLLPAVPFLVLALLVCDTHQQLDKEDRFGELHIKILSNLHTALVDAKKEKQIEYDKMRVQKNRERTEFETLKQQLEEQLRKDRELQFQQILNASQAQYEQFSGILNEIKVSIASTEGKKLGLHHLQLLRNISNVLSDSKDDSLRHFEEIKLEDETHHMKLQDQLKEDRNRVKTERNKQLTILQERANYYHFDLLKRFQDIGSMLGEARDCYELKQNGIQKSGKYLIRPDGFTDNFYVYCDMDVDEGGWTIIQRRGEFEGKAVNFTRDWNDYKRGFGNSHEFWLGNDRISALTRQKETTLRVDLRNFKGTPSHGIFRVFRVDNEDNEYRLTIKDYEGTTAQLFLNSDGQPFVTPGRNGKSENSCSERHSSGWWLVNGCENTSNLNGVPVEGSIGGIIWDGRETYAVSKMMIRPTKPKST